jgi:hypothetical protein
MMIMMTLDVSMTDMDGNGEVLEVGCCIDL